MAVNTTQDQHWTETLVHSDRVDSRLDSRLEVTEGVLARAIGLSIQVMSAPWWLMDIKRNEDGLGSLSGARLSSTDRLSWFIDL